MSYPGGSHGCRELYPCGPNYLGCSRVAVSRNELTKLDRVVKKSSRYGLAWDVHHWGKRRNRQGRIVQRLHYK
jgi:hypothetical protein